MPLSSYHEMRSCRHKTAVALGADAAFGVVNLHWPAIEQDCYLLIKILKHSPTCGLGMMSSSLCTLWWLAHAQWDEVACTLELEISYLIWCWWNDSCLSRLDTPNRTLAIRYGSAALLGNTSNHGMFLDYKQ